MLDELDTYIGGIRLSSIIEIILVAAFFYACLSWFRLATTPRAARHALITIFLYAASYFLARLLGFFFVELVIERAFILFLVTLVVVFQTEIHRMINRVMTWRPFIRSQPAVESADTVVQMLTEAAFSLGSRHTGALIAIRGRESWEGRLKGGILLDGRVSLPLLYSIFDKDTPGHDGAVLIEDDRLTRFGVHLPLSPHHAASSRFSGTRHAAARGISEVTDALAICVSEEHGTVSVAEKGHLDVLSAPDELQRRLSSFWSVHYGPASKKRATRPYQQLALGALSLILAVLLWVSLTAYRPGRVFRTYFVRVELSGVPDSLWTSGPEPANAQVTLTGSSGAFRALDETGLVVAVDLDNATRGTTAIRITEENVQTPPNLEVYEIEPDVIIVRTQPIVPRTMRIQVSPTGALPASLELTGLRASPDSITVLLPASEDPARRVLPLVVDMSQIDGPTTFIHQLDLPPRWRLPPGESAEIAITVEVTRRTPSSAPAE